MTKLKKQIFTAIILVLLMAGLGVSYYFLTKEPATPVDKTNEDTRVYIVAEVPNSSLNSIFVHNLYDEYTLVHKDSGAYKIEGLEDYEVDQTLLAMLRVNALKLLAHEVENADTSNTQVYGINKDDPAVYFEVRYNDNKDKYKIIIGDKTPDMQGYYAMLEGRDTLYILDTGVEGAILKPRRDYITPVLSDSVKSNEMYTLKNFSLNQKGKLFISIDKAVGKLTYGNNASHRLTFPAYNYSVSFANFEIFLEKILSVSGNTVLHYGDGITEELLLELGFFDKDGSDTSDYSFTYSFPKFSESFYVLEMDESEEYIVYSKNKNLIATMPKENLSFLSWEMLEWVSAEIFMLDIEDVKSIAFSDNQTSAFFTLQGKGDDLVVKCNEKVVNTPEFRELYRSIMYVIVTSFSDNGEYGNKVLEMNVTTNDGEELKYEFYAHSATNCYYTLNGFGEFYVSYEKVSTLKETAFKMIY